MNWLVGNLGLLCGIVETLFYTTVAFIFSGGFEKGGDPGQALLRAALVAVAFAAATFSVWKKRRE